MGTSGGALRSGATEEASLHDETVIVVLKRVQINSVMPEPGIVTHGGEASAVDDRGHLQHERCDSGTGRLAVEHKLRVGPATWLMLGTDL